MVESVLNIANFILFFNQYVDIILDALKGRYGFLFGIKEEETADDTADATEA